MTNAQLVPALLAPLILWRFYRRIRRQVGRQRLRNTRMAISVGIMLLVLCLVGVSLIHVQTALAGLYGGALVGIGLSVVGYKLTRFEVSAEGKFYTPNPYLGVALALLLIGRLIYRVASMYSGGGFADAGAASLGRSPLTFFVLGLTLGYYLGYGALVLRRMKTEPATGVSTS